MPKIKVIDLLKSLSADEMRQLDKFVRSPIHNKHEQVICLFKYLRKNLNKDLKNINGEKIFDHLFPGALLNMQKLHHISSYLMKVIEEFLAWKEWRNDNRNYHLSLMQAYHRLQLSKGFESSFNMAGESILAGSRYDISQLRKKYELELLRFEHDRTIKSASKISFNLQALSDAQDVAFIVEKLRNACILLSNQTVANVNYSTGLLTKIIGYTEKNKLYQNPAIAIYYFAIQTIKNKEDDVSYSKLKELLKDHQKSFNAKELHDIYIFSINYCIRRFNSGEQSFMKEVFDIYKLGMDTKAFLQNGTISPRTYSNVVMSGLRAKEHGWIEQFIFKYKEALPEKQREGYFNYNFARFHYDQGNFQKAMPLLQMMEYEDILLTCLGKILLAKMQYELGESEVLINHLQNFKAYLRRKKMLGYHKETCLNYIQITQKLVQGKFKNPSSLKVEIAETKVLAEKEWLLAQVKKIG